MIGIVLVVAVAVVALLVTIALASFGLLAGKRKTAALAVIALVTGVLLALAMFKISVVHSPGVPPSTMWRLIGFLVTMGLLVCFLVSMMSLILRFFAWLGAADPAGAVVNPEERKRILGMVEQGKMTGPEGTELLDALGKSSALRGQQTFSRLDILILVGIAATVLGFFLPWLWLPMQSGAVREVSGSVCSVVGWGMLVASGLAAALVFITPKEYLYKLLLLQVLCIFVGLALAASVWIGNAAIAGCGVMICVAGFAVALLGSVMKMRALGR